MKIGWQPVRKYRSFIRTRIEYNGEATEVVMSRTITMLKSLTAAAVVFVASPILFPSPVLAQQDYQTPQAAIDALVAAAKSKDQKAALVVFGRNGEDIISSGDKVADEVARQKFVASYEAKHGIEAEGPRKSVLVIGNDDYPFPVPILRNKNGTWSFDTNAGRREILLRRVGRNELNTIQTCLAYVDAQNDYASKDRGSGTGVYAQRFISQPGKKDGLYWPAAQGEDESPIGLLFADASREGYRTGEGRTPYHGYYFKILTKQGPAAPGGAADYVLNGKMIGGFALVAYPAQYRNSGVMTFIVNYDGKVFQKDLGPGTAKVANTMKAYNPDSSWAKVDTKGVAK
jgi:hypothetical protein